MENLFLRFMIQRAGHERETSAAPESGSSTQLDEALSTVRDKLAYVTCFQFQPSNSYIQI